MKHDFGNSPMVHDTYPQQAWCYRCYLLVNYGEGEQPCTGNPHDEVARLSALVQGMETWLTEQERKADDLRQGKPPESVQMELGLSCGFHLAWAELQRLKGQP